MSDIDPYELEVAISWIRDKGVSVWPSLPDADATKPEEAEQLAKWFLEQAADLNRYHARKYGWPPPYPELQQPAP